MSGAALLREVTKTHAETFRAELALLAARGAFPHVVAVFPTRTWPHVCAVLGSGIDGVDLSAPEELPSSVHRYQATLAGRHQELLLVRIAHPAARTRKGRVADSLADPKFRLAVGGRR